MSYRILICDDHEHARKAMRIILAEDERFTIVGEAKRGDEILFLTEQLMPDMILMDINMPSLNGLEATRLVKERFPYVKIVMVTVSDDVTNLFEAIKNGAQGYLVKNLNPSIWLSYLHALATDSAPMPQAIANRILAEFTGMKSSDHTLLTPREQEILTRVAQGLSNREIAVELVISEYTVKNHLKNIMQKLHLNNRVQLTRYAYEQGFMKRPT
ncbi:response regulator [Shimazuella alba]|uniref:Response regulator n=1 Tax=Shimazuella alba TaxID=2690964 RepID=A0A6I4VX07_9BACL|nr:response regulator transcription factor [Shimazuella alba]MXQ54565.1 response regulator [Shimazuella alba]